MELAERLPRLWAAIVDRAIYVPFALVAAIVLPGLRRSDAMVPAIAVIVLLAAALFIYQAWLVSTTGQTIGKKLFRVRIVKVPDLSPGGFVSNFLLRTVAMWAIGFVPFLGTLVVLADALFIFREDRRCIHDHIAGTCVIKA